MVSFAQETQVDTLGQHPWRKTDPVSTKLTNWSLFLNCGFNVFDGDFSSEKKHSVMAPNVGLGFEYSFNPTWGIGAEYMFRNYGVQGSGEGSTVDGPLLRGRMHQIDAFITFDLFNVWRSQNTRKIFALNLLIGGGYYWNFNNTYYPNEYAWRKDAVTGNEYQYLRYHTDTQTPEGRDGEYGKGSDAVIIAGAMFEFNLSRSISLGVRAQYNMSVHDVLDGRVRGNNNDGVFDVNAILRWKIDARKKTHVRNLSSTNAMKMIMAMGGSGTGTGSMYGLGKDTVVIYHKDTVVIKNLVQVSEFQDDYGYIYFANDAADLDNQGLVVIQQFANKMMRNDSLYAVVIGYCDATGTVDHNDSLGVLRARNVAEEMMEEYGVPSDHILPIGRGMIKSTRRTGSYSPNRRAEIRLMNKTKFDRETRKYYDAKDDIKAIKSGKGREVVVAENMTLSQLARMYFNNTHCWVYIYLANQSVLSNPNDIQEGDVLVIPQLDEQQKNISREQAAQLYRELR